MSYRIGIVSWMTDDEGIVRTLQGDEIPFSYNRAGPEVDHLHNGAFTICEAYPRDYAQGRHLEAVNLRELSAEKNEDVLLACFDQADREMAARALNTMPPFGPAKNIRSKLGFDNPLHTKEEQPAPDELSSENSDSRAFFIFLKECLFAPRHPVHWPLEDTSVLIDQNDQKLALKWGRGVQNDYAKAQMLSARLAEKVAQKFYRQLGHKVKDIALTQLTGENDEWPKCDILLDGANSVDVKNARSTYNNKSGYVEYCVPSFKKDRCGCDVYIAGVFSPYLKLEYLLNQRSVNFEIHDTYFLGETTRTKIRELENSFNSPKLSITVFTKPDDELNHEGILPPWIFDYPEAFYRERSVIKDKLKRMDPAVYPDKRYWKHDFNPVPAFVASKLPIPLEWTDVSPGQRKFIEKLYQHSGNRIALPVLFLSILTDFLQRVASTDTSPDFNPRSFYKPILFDPQSLSLPLGIRDPLDLIFNLITTLHTLWEHRSWVPWNEIETFQFKGLGLFVGRKYSGETITLLAYCGGRIEGKGKCGHSPLIIGQNRTCENGKLICDKCHYCCEKCKNLHNEEDRVHTQENDCADYLNLEGDIPF